MERKRRDIDVGAVYDIETEGWSKFLVGGHYDGKTYQERDWRKEEELRSIILGGPSPTWAHNGGIFDHKWLLDGARNSSAQIGIRCAGSRLVEVRWGDQRLLDSKAIAKLSLDKFTDGLGVEKMEQPLQCDMPKRHGPWCRGYCNFRRGMRRADFQRVREYLRADCESLWLALGRLREWAEVNDLDLAPTIGAAAWANARRLLDLEPAQLPLAGHLYCREAYFGGRVQVFRPRLAKGFAYDVSAMYPAALHALALPVGMAQWATGSKARSLWGDGRAGIFTARVSVPDMWIPPLPVRTAERIAYPVGSFVGRWTALELRYAESVGVKVEDVTEAMVWPEERNIFRPWIQKLWKLRASAKDGKSGPFGTFLKFYMNSLTGKLGTDPRTEEVYFNPKKVTLPMRQLGQGFYSKRASGHVLRSGRWLAGQGCCHVAWAAYLTSWGRVEWHKEAVSKNGGADVAYCDTDCLRTGMRRTRRVGKGLGQWLFEGRFTDFEANAPKFYRMKLDGEEQIKSKGVSAIFPEEWDSLFETGEHVFNRTAIAGFKTALRGGSLFQTASLARHVKKGYGDRILGADGRTYPQTAEALGYEGVPRKVSGSGRTALSAFEEACLAGSVG
jgi:DNA polymerase type B, organellar and viral